MNRNELKKYANDPHECIDNFIIRTGDGPQRFGDVAFQFQRDRLADLAPALFAVATGKKPDKTRHFWEATKGGSKDSDLAACLLWLLSFSSQVLHCQVGAADKDQAGELLKAAKTLLHLNTWLAEIIEIQQWSIINKQTESRCDIIAADVAGSHGARPNVLILNELSCISKQEFAENLMDNATKVSDGLVIIATNSGFLDTWQHDWRELARTSPRWTFHKWDKPAPWLSEAEIDEARKRNPKSRFMRLFEGRWVVGTENGLDYDAVKRCVTLPGPHGHPFDSFTYFCSVDLAATRDWAAVVVIGFDIFQDPIELHVADVRDWSPQQFGGAIDLGVVESCIIELAKRYGFESVLFDPMEGRQMMGRLAQRGLRIHKWQSSPKYQKAMATDLMECVNDQLLCLYEHERLIADLLKLSIEEKQYGYRITFPRDEFGHCDRGAALVQGIPFALESIRGLRRTAYAADSDCVYELAAT